MTRDPALMQELLTLDLLSVPQVADELGVSRQRALQLVNSGQLVAVKVGDSWVVPRRSVIDRVAERAQSSEVTA